MYVSLIIWILLLLPGYAVVRRWCRVDLATGLLPTIGVSFLATLALLSPLSIAAYLLGLPVWVFSACIVLLILAGGFDLFRDAPARREVWALLRGGLGVGLALILFDLVIAGIAGGYLTGDASVHVTRVRYLLDHGFSNTDPFVGAYFWPIYHTNLYHAVLASVSQLSMQPYLEVWAGTIVPMKLLVACALYSLTFAIFRSVPAAWAAAIFGIVVHTTGGLFAQLLVYPNTLVPWGLIPFVFVFAIQLLEPPGEGRTAPRLGGLIKLAAMSLIIGQIHGLYVLFVVAFIATPLGVYGVWHLVRQRRAGATGVLAAAALCIGMLFPVISALGRANVATPATVDPIAKRMERQSHRSHFVRLDNGWIMRNYRSGFTAPGRWYRPALLVVAMIVVPLVMRRRSSWLLIAAALGVAAMLFVPPLCTLAFSILGRSWIVLRGQAFFYLAFAILVPGMFGLLLQWVMPPRVMRHRIVGEVFLGAFLVCVLIIGTFYNHDPTRLGDYVAHAFEQPAKRSANLTSRGHLYELMAQNIPPGETILLKEELSALVPAVYDVHIVVSRSSSLGVPDRDQREIDLGRMLGDDTPWPERRALLKKYDIRYFMPSGTERLDWTRGHVVREVRDPRIGMILQLEPDS